MDALSYKEIASKLYRALKQELNVWYDATVPADPWGAIEVYESKRLSEESVGIKKGWRLAIDFDGVINSYTSGFLGEDKAAVLPDPPVNGAREFLNKALLHFEEVVIYTTRATFGMAAVKAMQDYCERYDLPILPIYGEKIPADVYLDDRAVRFNGRFPDPADLKGLGSWVHPAGTEDKRKESEGK